MHCQENSWKLSFLLRNLNQSWSGCISSPYGESESRSVVRLFAIPGTTQPMEFSRILERVAFPFPRGSSHPRDRTQVSRITGGFFTSWATREAQEYWSGQPLPSPAGLPNSGIEPGSSYGTCHPYTGLSSWL